MADESRAIRGRAVVRGFANIGLGTLASRFSGFVREVVTAAMFGAGTSMDIFVAAFTIPNLLCRILGESTVESAFMPLFRGLHARGETRRAWRLASRSIINFTIALTIMVLVGLAISPFLVSVVAHGFTGEVAEATVYMTRLMFPFGLFIGLAALMGAILLSFQRYRVYSLAPVMLNMGIVVSVLLLRGRMSYVSLAIGVLVGGLLQFLVQVPFAARLAGRDGARLIATGGGLRDPDMKQVAALSVPVLIESSIQRVGVIVDRTIASFLIPGSISSLYYSFRLVHLPYAILALAAGRAVAPHLAEQHALGQHREFRETLISGLGMNMAYLLPVVLLTVWFARPIVGIVYERGAFDANDLSMTASALAMYAVGLPGMGATFILVRAFAAKLDTRTPVGVAVAAFFMNVGLNLLLVRTPLKHAGLALASSIAFTAHAVILYMILNRRARAEGNAIRPTEMLAQSGKVVAAGAIMLAVAWAVDTWLGMRLADSILLKRVARLVIAGGAGVLAYLGAARLMGLEEVTHLITRTKRS
ncbi:MAG: murein biosynthesis integral membrane protein MurJ [Candidatus Eisenbacteria bacterium]|nr:murein biosynthesis integral membrane protein MurJ [Candidatus Eisenbacteria bacterium]